MNAKLFHICAMVVVVSILSVVLIVNAPKAKLVIQIQINAMIEMNVKMKASVKMVAVLTLPMDITACVIRVSFKVKIVLIVLMVGKVLVTLAELETIAGINYHIDYQRKIVVVV